MRSRTALRFSAFIAFSSLSLASPLIPSASAQTPTDTFTIAGDVCCLTPGVQHAIDVTLTNPNTFAIDVNSLTTRVASSPPDCDAATNVRLDQSLVSPSNTVALPAHGSVTLAAADRPKIELINLPVNQDACKDETFALTYSGTAIAPDAEDAAAPGAPPVVIQGIADPPPPSPGKVAVGEGSLPRTGAYIGTFVLTGLGLVVLGGLLRLSSRRRRTERSH